MITLHIPTLAEYSLSPNEYTIAYLLYIKDYANIDSLVPTLNLSQVLSNLVTKGFVKMPEDELDIPDNDINLTLIKVTDSFKQVLGTEDTDIFSELRKVFPTETPNGRKLQTNLSATKKKYLSIVKGNKELHDLILKAVTLEVKSRIKQSSLDYMRLLSTYVNQRGWEEYMSDVKQLEERSKTGGENKQEGDRQWTKIL